MMEVDTLRGTPSQMHQTTLRRAKLLTSGTGKSLEVREADWSPTPWQSQTLLL